MGGDRVSANPPKIPLRALKHKRVAQNNPTEFVCAYTASRNMNPAIAPITNQRLTRLFTWAGLWLVWAGAVLAGVSCGFRASRTLERPRRKIALMARFVIALLVLHAAHHVARVRRVAGAYGPNALRPLGIGRAYAGGALRRKLRAPSLLARIAKLSDALRNPERYIGSIAKRMARGLTKRVRVFAPVFVVASLCAPSALSEAALDSS